MYATLALTCHPTDTPKTPHLVDRAAPVAVETDALVPCTALAIAIAVATALCCGGLAAATAGRSTRAPGQPTHIET